MFLCSGRRSCQMNFATTRCMPRSWVKISDTVFLELPGQLLFSHCQSPIFVDCSLYTFNILRCSACSRPSRTWITFNTFLTIFEAFVPHIYLHWTHCIVPESLQNHLNSFCGEMFKLNAKFDADSLLYKLSHFECDGHTVHRLTQWCLPPPLTSTVKLSLFTHVHSSPLSFTARLHRCHAIHFRCVNSGWNFSGRTFNEKTGFYFKRFEVVIQGRWVYN